MQHTPSIVNKTAALLAEHNVTPKAGPMLCGLSGGADSVALVLVLQALGYRVVALHCNFQLRGEESERDERFVRRFCTAHGLELHTVRFDTPTEAAAHGESIEMAARRLRYDWFESVRSTMDGGAQVCVAHHADDNVETMLLNLIRGAGLHGLTGMAFRNDRGILRPLLAVTRAEILAYLEAKGESFVTDSSNTDTRYRRNKVRHELLPLLRTMNPNVDSVLTETMKHLREAEGTILAGEGGEDYRRMRTLQALGFTTAQIAQMTTAANGAYTTSGDVMLTKHRGALLWGRIPPRTAPSPIVATRRPRTEVTFLRDASVGVFDAGAVSGPLFIRSVEAGDRFRPFGMKGTKLVSDYLTDRHRSRLDKLAALVVCDDNGILWLVGETIDQRAAVTQTTTEVVVVEMKE